MARDGNKYSLHHSLASTVDDIVTAIDAALATNERDMDSLIKRMFDSERGRSTTSGTRIA